MLRTVIFWSICTVCFTAQSSLAAERLDDSTSPRARISPPVVLSDEGRPLADSLNPQTATAKLGGVQFRLGTARYVGKQSRIYFVIPATVTGLSSPTGLRVSWLGNGPWVSGSAYAGERRLIWSGILREAWTLVELDITLHMTLRDLQLPRNGRLGFEPYFEIEASP